MRGPTVSWSRGPMRCASAPDAEENSNIRSVAGSNAIPARRADQPAADLQFVDDEEERNADRGVQQHGREVHDGELATAEQARAGRADRGVCSIRYTNATIPSSEITPAASTAVSVHPCGPGFGERPGRRAERHDREARAEEVEPRSRAGRASPVRRCVEPRRRSRRPGR